MTNTSGTNDRTFVRFLRNGIFRCFRDGGRSLQSLTSGNRRNATRRRRGAPFAKMVERNPSTQRNDRGEKQGIQRNEDIQFSVNRRFHDCSFYCFLPGPFSASQRLTRSSPAFFSSSVIDGNRPSSILTEVISPRRALSVSH